MVTQEEAAPSLAVELFSYREAARVLRVPPSTLRWWLEGRQRGSIFRSCVPRPRDGTR